MASRKKPATEGAFPGMDSAAGRAQWKKFSKFLDDCGIEVTIKTTEKKPGRK